MSRFIKFIPSEKSDFLMRHYPNAFVLLSLIAQRARRVSGQVDGLQIGDAILGDYESSGLTRQQYRTALKKLVDLAFIEIVYNGKKFLKREKSTIKSTIKGMIVNLIDSSVWDINSDEVNQHINQRSTNDQPTINHKQERTRKNKNEKETTTPKPPKGDRVVVLFDCLKENNELTQDEKESLQRFPQERVKLALEFAKIEKPKKTLVHLLFWHCSEKNPPVARMVHLTPQQKLAYEFNDYLLSIGEDILYYENKKNIEEGQLILIPLFGSPMPVSLKNELQILRKDFDESKSHYKQLKYCS